MWEKYTEQIIWCKAKSIYQQLSHQNQLILIPGPHCIKLTTDGSYAVNGNFHENLEFDLLLSNVTMVVTINGKVTNNGKFYATRARSLVWQIFLVPKKHKQKTFATYEWRLWTPPSTWAEGDLLSKRTSPAYILSLKEEGWYEKDRERERERERDWIPSP